MMRGSTLLASSTSRTENSGGRRLLIVMMVAKFLVVDFIAKVVERTYRMLLSVGIG